jgi:hypothetical protein
MSNSNTGSNPFPSRPRPQRPLSISSNSYSPSLGNNEPMSPPPFRPERSQRRPSGFITSPPVRTHDTFPDPRNNRNQNNNSHRNDYEESDTDEGGSPQLDSVREGVRSGEGGQTKSRRMMESLNMRIPSPLVAQTPVLSEMTHSRKDSFESATSQLSQQTMDYSNNRRSRGGMQQEDEERQRLQRQEEEEYQRELVMQQKQVEQAQQKKQQSEARRLERKKKESTLAAVLDPREYPDTPAFREIEAVLRKIRTDWPIILQDSSEEVIAGTEFNKFDPVTLALSLLNPATVGTPVSLPSFLRLKAELDHAISTTLASSSTSYRAYESGITTYNSTLVTLGNNIKAVEELKKGLIESREKLEGKGREGLNGMYNRMGHLEEMVKILDEMWVCMSLCSIHVSLTASNLSRLTQ